MRPVTPAAIALIKHYESLHDGDLTVVGLQPKLCPAGIWTIGWGHAMTNKAGEFLRGEKDKAEAYAASSLSEGEAEALLVHDVSNFAACVELLIRYPANDNQFSALVSLAYNIGVNAFRGSTVLRELNNGHILRAADAILMWNKSGGKVLNFLVKRREAEREMFLS